MTMIGRSGLFHFGQNLEGIFIRHDDIGNDEITFAQLNPSPQRCRVSGRARGRQSLTEESPDGCIIITNEDIASDHQPAPSCRRKTGSYPPNSKALRGFPRYGGRPRLWTPDFSLGRA
jgi:hypothetical protein